MKKLRILLLFLASLVATAVVASPAQAVETCGEAQLCFYVDKNFQGFRTRFWDDQNQLNRKLDFRANSESRTVSSIKNLTPYYFRMWNSKGQNRCIAPSFQSANLGRWEDDVKYIGFYTKC